jgi:hypothetical protein
MFEHILLLYTSFFFSFERQWNLFLKIVLPVFNFSRLGEDSDGESAQDMSSESDHEHLRCRCLVNSISADQDGFSSDDSESGNQELYPVFQYMEHDAPYGRQPLADMVHFFFFLISFLLANEYCSCNQDDGFSSVSGCRYHYLLIDFLI